MACARATQPTISGKRAVVGLVCLGRVKVVKRFYPPVVSRPVPRYRFAKIRTEAVVAAVAKRVALAALTLPPPRPWYSCLAKVVLVGNTVVVAGAATVVVCQITKPITAWTMVAVVAWAPLKLRGC